MELKTSCYSYAIITHNIILYYVTIYYYIMPLN